MSTQLEGTGERRAHELAALYSALPQVVAVALGGSRSSGAADAASDIDLYVYVDAELPTAAHAAVIARAGGADGANLGLPYWGGTNLWIDRPTGIMVDAVVFGAAWMAEQIGAVLDEHRPSLGYSTCFCRTVQQSQVLYDPAGWLAALKVRTGQPYPETLRRNIVRHNHPVLRGMMTSYLHQIESAAKRADAVSVNHRVAGLLASYFDIVFALNRVWHPGEKRQLQFARQECSQLPADMDADIAAVLAASGAAGDAVVGQIGRLLDRLDDLLRADGFDLGVE